MMTRRISALLAAVFVAVSVLVTAAPVSAQTSGDTRIVTDSSGTTTKRDALIAQGWECVQDTRPGATTFNVTTWNCTNPSQAAATSAAAAVTTRDCQQLRGDAMLYSRCMQLAAVNYEPHTYLPAWRWRQMTGLEMAPGWFSGAANVPLSALAELLFLISSFIWSALLFVLRYGTSLDVLAGTAGASINDGFVSLGQALQRSGVWVVALLLAFFTAGRMLLKGSISGLVSMVVGLLVPLGLLFAMTALTTNPSAKVDRNGLPIGSPAWIGVTGVRMVDQIGNAVGNGLSGLPQSTGASASTADGTVCDAYRQQLVDLEERQTRADRADANAMALVSRMWETSFLSSWMSAQYGSVDAGSTMYCFDLEARLGVDPQQQADLLRDATDGRLTISSAAFLSSTPDNTDDRAKIFMFAACAPDPTTGKVSSQPGWAALGGPSDDDCNEWLSSGETTGVAWGTSGELSRARNRASRTSDATFTYNTVRAVWGHNSVQRITEGIVAVITAVVYLYVLGGISVGAILAQYGLFLMLILFPVTLVMLALPSSSGRRNQTGVRMLKITGGFFFAKMALTLVLSLLVVSSTLLGSLIPARAGGSLGAGSMLSLAHAFVPLVSLFLVRKLLTTLGLGDITKLSGAVGLSAATSAAATGDRRFRTQVSKGMAESRAGRMASRVDARVKDRTVGAAQRKAARAKASAKSAWSASDTRARLDPLVGRKDAEGNVVASSALARGRANLHARKAQAVANGLGWATANGAKFGGNRVQKALGGSKVMRQAWEDHITKAHGAKEAHTLARESTQRMQELNKSLSGKTRSERQHTQREWVDGLIDNASSAHLATLGIDKESGLLNAEDRQKLTNEAMTLWGVRNPDALTKHTLSSEEGGPPIVVSGQGRRGPGGTVAGRFEGMGVSASELHQLLRHNPEMMLLPPEVQRRHAGESESQHHSRLLVTSIAMGLRDTEGVPIDATARTGLSDDQIEHELTKALRGEANVFDTIPANVSAQTLATVDAAMLARHARHRVTGAPSPAVKKAQLAEAQKELVEAAASAMKVNESVSAVFEQLSTGADSAVILAAMDALSAVGIKAAQQAASVVTNAAVYKQDVSSNENLAELLARIPEQVAPLEQSGEDLAARIQYLQETVRTRVSPAEQRIAAFEANQPVVRQQLQVYLDDEAALRAEIARAAADEREDLERQLTELLENARRQQLEAELANMERERQEAQKTIDAIRKMMLGEMEAVAKSEAGKLTSQIDKARTTSQHAFEQAERKYDADDSSAARVGAKKLLRTRFDATVSTPLP
jgi:hypothetical protein